MTLAEYRRSLRQTLGKCLDMSEAAAAADIILEDVGHYGRTTIIADGDRTVEEGAMRRMDGVAARIVDGEPVQYAVGSALFMGNNYIVSPAVLIPRPETAALVDMIVDDAGGRSDLRVLDIGTGSGCIAISLARALHFAHVTAFDISDDALAIARRNAAVLAPAVDFENVDILDAPMPEQPCYDIIVSNPPYVTDAERVSMDSRVLQYEPSKALFVPDNDPLIFYRAIARYSRCALTPGGRLYLEINSLYPNQMRSLLDDSGFENVDILPDYKNNIRYATATQPSDR